MRAFFLAVVLALGGFFLAGCSSSPSEPAPSTPPPPAPKDPGVAVKDKGIGRLPKPK